MKCPGTSCWIAMSLGRILAIQAWLINNCFVRLGDEVWRQKTGIPMGFSCSQLWCNLYFMAYEVRFITRLIKLKRYDLLPMFEHSYRYIDDICILNAPTIAYFLDANQMRTPDNPWWIYPLDILEISPEMTKSTLENKDWGIDAHRIMITNTTTGTYHK